jgi:hypothetical protein
VGGQVDGRVLCAMSTDAKLTLNREHALPVGCVEVVYTCDA